MLKDDVVTFTAHLSVTIKRLTRYKQKVVLAAEGGMCRLQVTSLTTGNFHIRFFYHSLLFLKV